MRSRALLHVDGPPGAGKTTFVERLLDAEVAFALCVRAVRDPKLRQVQASAPRNRAELGRYRAAGAAAASLYRFPTPDADAFFAADFMQEYSEAVFIEGDCPIDYVDLAVFIAPVTPDRRPLLRRVRRDRAAERAASIQQMSHVLESPEALARFVGGGLGERFVEMMLARPELVEGVRRSMRTKLEDMQRAPAPAPKARWALEEGYQGIERAQLVVVNVRDDQERPHAEALLEDLARLRKDDVIFQDVIGLRGNKLPITAVIANLANAKDPGLKKAVARVKRATKQREP